MFSFPSADCPPKICRAQRGARDSALTRREREGVINEADRGGDFFGSPVHQGGGGGGDKGDKEGGDKERGEGERGEGERERGEGEREGDLLGRGRTSVIPFIPVTQMGSSPKLTSPKLKWARALTDSRLGVDGQDTPSGPSETVHS